MNNKRNVISFIDYVDFTWLELICIFLFVIDGYYYFAVVIINRYYFLNNNNDKIN